MDLLNRRWKVKFQHGLNKKKKIMKSKHSTNRRCEDHKHNGFPKKEKQILWFIKKGKRKRHSFSSDLQKSHKPASFWIYKGIDRSKHVISLLLPSCKNIALDRCDKATSNLCNLQPRLGEREGWRERGWFTYTGKYILNHKLCNCIDFIWYRKGLELKIDFQFFNINLF